MRSRLAIAALAFATAGAAAAATLFPEPLHITRQIEDGVTRSRVTVEEYCEGNRIVAVRGDHVAIADYARRELTEIDRAAGTWSVTTFAAIASAQPAQRDRHTWRSERAEHGARFRRDDGLAELAIDVDRSVALTREGLESLIGAVDPQTHDARQEAIRAVAAGATAGSSKSGSRDSALPLRQTLTEGDRTIAATEVLHVDGVQVPPQLIRIDVAMRRVESTRLRVAAAAAGLDALPRVLR